MFAVNTFTRTREKTIEAKKAFRFVEKDSPDGRNLIFHNKEV